MLLRIVLIVVLGPRIQGGCQGPEPTRSLGPASEPTRARLRSSRLMTSDH